MVRPSFLYTLLAIVSTTCCLAANTISARLGLFPWGPAPMGVFSFPLIYVISDIVSDIYGYRLSRWMAWCVLLANCLFLTLILGPSAATAPLVPAMDEAIWLIFKPAVWVMIGGILGAVIGGWVNDVIFQLFRHRDGIVHFYRRKLISSLGAEVVDTLVFISVAFGVGMGLWSIIPMMMIAQFCMKYAVEVILMFPTKLVVNKLRRIEGEEVFEDRNKFNIFGFAK